MMTVITETSVQPGQEQEWDNAFRARAKDAQKQPGWVATQLLIPADDRQKRVVVGTWQDQESWERWHNTDSFQQTRDQLNSATVDDGNERWFEVMVEQASGDVAVG
ncbi:MAG TPA: antibiotic biosynthesis monooxygenase family protein [Thermomicrobiales bacterium]|nr:antibiotic biosynthesis monooxygenase family protein [Thermomicrobiales bacterium]